jgi:CRISPR-associated exonuclease Cas4
MSDDLVNISDLNQYLYCPRRLYYLIFYQTQGLNVYLADGRALHNRQSRRGGWYREVYLRSEDLHMHGKIDIIERAGDAIVPVERKHGSRYYENDQVQLAAYAMLLEEYLGEPVPAGYLYLYETNTRHPIEITDSLRGRVVTTVEKIRSMKVDEIPAFSDNPNKCRKCSAVTYCMPYEVRLLEEV